MAPFEMLYGHRGRTPSYWNETGKCKVLDLTYWRKSRDKFAWWRTCTLRNQDRRDMSIIGEENWILKLEITHASRCHLCEDYDISRYEANLHLGSRSWKRERRIEDRSSEFLFRSIRISRMRFILRGGGVGLSHPKIKNFVMWIKFAKI
jgi:hypothetical protein